jgi:hypothetical protein
MSPTPLNYADAPRPWRCPWRAPGVVAAALLAFYSLAGTVTQEEGRVDRSVVPTHTRSRSRGQVGSDTHPD